jgi:hypothetical protein
MVPSWASTYRSVRVAKSGDVDVEEELALWGNKFRRSIVEMFNFLNQFIAFNADDKALTFVVEGDIAEVPLGMGDSKELGEKLGHPMVAVEACWGAKEVRGLEMENSC